MHTAVFISYARIKDQYGGVTKFHSALDKAVKERFNMETQVFMDKKGITAGENFNDVIKAQLKEASVLIIFYLRFGYPGRYAGKSINISNPYKTPMTRKDLLSRSCT